MNMFFDFVVIVLNNHMFKGKGKVKWLTFCVTSLIFTNIWCLNTYGEWFNFKYIKWWFILK
jgi:hypothetical protein